MHTYWIFLILFNRKKYMKKQLFLLTLLLILSSTKISAAGTKRCIGFIPGFVYLTIEGTDIVKDGEIVGDIKLITIGSAATLDGQEGRIQDVYGCVKTRNRGSSPLASGPLSEHADALTLHFVPNGKTSDVVQYTIQTGLWLARDEHIRLEWEKLVAEGIIDGVD